MWKAGALKKNEESNFDMVPDPEEQAQLKQQREVEEQIASVQQQHQSALLDHDGGDGSVINSQQFQDPVDADKNE